MQNRPGSALELYDFVASANSRIAEKIKWGAARGLMRSRKATEGGREAPHNSARFSPRRGSNRLEPGLRVSSEDGVRSA
jgi:hypothetical protein